MKTLVAEKQTTIVRHEVHNEHDTYRACFFQKHPVAELIDAEHFAQLFGRVVAVSNGISWYDIPILYPVRSFDGLDFLFFK
jgi:hypothetical protein